MNATTTAKMLVLTPCVKLAVVSRIWSKVYVVDFITNTKEFVFSAFLQSLEINIPVGCCAISQIRVDATIHGDWMFCPFTGFGFQ